VYAASLGATPGELPLYLPGHSVHASFISREEGAQQIQCRVETVDRVIDSGVSGAPDVIKIDVEGAELQVLQGASKCITHHQPVVVFESDENMDRFGYGRPELLEFFASKGRYHFYYINEDGELLDGGDLSDMRYSDIVAVPEGRLLGGEGK
jgi:hypothetical protein